MKLKDLVIEIVRVNPGISVSEIREVLQVQKTEIENVLTTASNSGFIVYQDKYEQLHVFYEGSPQWMLDLPAYYVEKFWIAQQKGFEFTHHEDGGERVIRVYREGKHLGEGRGLFISHACNHALGIVYADDAGVVGLAKIPKGEKV